MCFMCFKKIYIAFFVIFNDFSDVLCVGGAGDVVVVVVYYFDCFLIFLFYFSVVSFFIRSNLEFDGLRVVRLF